MPDKAKTRRLFFALWPDDKTRQQISQHIVPNLQKLNGRKVSQQQWHITLAFLGNVTNEVADCVQQQAEHISTSSFDITLDTLGHWSRPKVVWLGCSEKPHALQILVNKLNEALRPCGYIPEYPDFKVHMTLMRKVARKPNLLQFRPVTWQVNRFVLVESQLDNRGSEYTILGEWAF